MIPVQIIHLFRRNKTFFSLRNLLVLERKVRNSMIIDFYIILVSIFLVAYLYVVS